MRLPSASRLAGIALAIAAVTIVALATLALNELEREVQLNREVIAGLQVKDSLEALREEISELSHAARLSMLGVPSAAQEVERRAVEIGAELEYLEQNPQREDRAAFEELTRAAQFLVVAARSAASAPKGHSPEEIERAARQAMGTVQHMLESQGAGVNDRMIAQIRVGETLHTYVSWFLGGSALVLVGLLGFYARAKSRERLAAERIERLAHYDMLTGLPNRTLLADRLDREVERAKRTGRGFALLMFDLDGFKAVNDTWGHAAGDELLAMVGMRTRECVRSADTVGRLGGDEFLAILPEASHEGALLVAEKLREAISRPYALRGASATIGASVGISYLGEHGNEAEALQRAADNALYEAKRRGKNRVLEAA